MRYSASEKFEIIELVEQSSLSIRRTLAPIGIPRSTFYDWYSRYQEGGIEALVDGKPRPRRIWNKIPDKIETAIVNLALEEPDLSPRELAVNFTDTKGSFVSEATLGAGRSAGTATRAGGGSSIVLSGRDWIGEGMASMVWVLLGSGLGRTDASNTRTSAGCMSSEHFGQLAWQFKRMSGSSGLKVQAAIAC